VREEPTPQRRVRGEAEVFRCREKVTEVVVNGGPSNQGGKRKTRERNPRDEKRGGGLSKESGVFVRGGQGRDGNRETKEIKFTYT